MNKTIQIIFLAVIFLVPVFSIAGNNEPEEVYKQNQEFVTSHTNIHSVNPFISSRNLASRNNYIEKLKVKGMSEEDIHKKLLKRTLRRMSCTKDLPINKQK